MKKNQVTQETVAALVADQTSGNTTVAERILLAKVFTNCAYSVERRSAGEYDLTVTGIRTEAHYFNKNEKVQTRFSAWLPLAAVRELTRWYANPVASMTDYPEMAGAGDWSGVRDTDEARLWEIFRTHVLKTAAAPAPTTGLVEVDPKGGDCGNHVRWNRSTTPGALSVWMPLPAFGQDWNHLSPATARLLAAALLEAADMADGHGAFPLFPVKG